MVKNRSGATRTAGGLIGLALLGLGLSGCSQDTLGQWGRFGLPEAASDRAPHIGNLWIGAWWASLIIGVFVWGLIFYAIIRFRRRKDETGHPRQVRYNLPLELLYTLVPFLIIGVLFFFTVQSQNAVLAKETQPVHTINVVGQKWSWTFNYMEDGNPAVGAIVHESGTIEKIPDLYLPLNKPVRFNLASADVIHSFWVPDFYFKLDVIPGHPNSFDVTPTKAGDFLGKCAELCGTYHSAMVFNVHVVDEQRYNDYLKSLATRGQTGEVKPPAFPNTAPSVPVKKEG